MAQFTTNGKPFSKMRIYKSVIPIQPAGILFLITIMAAMFLFPGCRKTVSESYPSGKNKAEMNYKGKKLDGTSVWWYENGTKQQEIAYLDGLVDGKLTKWYATGIKSLEESYSGGQRNGKSRTWDELGNILEEKNYANDTLHGNYKMWHPSGMAKIQGAYFGGFYQGRWEYFDETGVRVGEGNFKKGSGKQLAYNRNGKIIRAVSYKNNSKDGPETWYAADGKPIKEILWNADKFVSEKQF